MNQDDLEDLYKSTLKNTRSTIQIFEEGIDIHTQNEFEKQTHKYIKRNKKKSKLSLLRNLLLNSDNATEKEKKMH